MSSFSFSNDYLKYLRSPEWDIIRKRRIQFDQGRCKNCGAKLHLQVHNLSYDRLGDEDVKSDLKTLCVDCHLKVERFKRRKRSVVCE
jgi:5-methylcytosine-specific restriction endonuclease McrA